MTLDFTSALYLGLRHGHGELSPWPALTTGRPAALGAPPLAEEMATLLATHMGCERALLAPSTLHLFFDLFDALGREDIVIFAESGLYPILRWGVERAAAKGAPVVSFPAGDADALARRISAAPRKQPIVVCEGLRPPWGRLAPLADYVALVRRRCGLVVLDDTQALGVLGADPAPERPYGRGGGGTAAHLGVAAPELAIGASLAKGYGAPLAVGGGSRKFIEFLERASPTRTHCSPPSIAEIAAAARALEIEGRCGDRLRRHLGARVAQFRTALGGLGLFPAGGLFPAQTLERLVDPVAFAAALARRGVACVAHEGRGGVGAASFLVTAAHRPGDIAAAAAAIADALKLRHVRVFEEIDP